MGVRFADAADEAYRYPLLITHLLRSAVDARTGAEIVGTDGRRYDYPELERRVGRLAEVLARHGVGQGDVVAVLDWDSHRYLEAYFAVPMMGAVLQTADGLPLKKLTSTRGLRWAVLSKESGTKAIIMLQSDGAVVEEFRIGRLGHMMAFDAGKYEVKP